MTGITFQAIFATARTTVDGGWRITFDVLSHEGPKVVELSKLMAHPVHVVILTDDQLNRYEANKDSIK